MEEYKEKPIEELIGDFYEGHATKNDEKRETALKKIQNLIFTASIDSKPFMDYFNEIFSGRTAYNTLLSINDYPKESIIRELLQNTFGCHYATKDIKVLVDFNNEEKKISISYNEVGFTMEQILYYLSFGRNDGDATREGRFGVGAKSVFLNVESLYLHSNNFSFKIRNDNGNLKIVHLDLFGSQFKGTEITIKVNDDEFEKIRENFLTLTEKRGDYINLMELCFAFNRKKILDIDVSDKEEPERSFNIAVKDGGQLVTLYKIIQYQKSPDAAPVIRFMQNNKSVIDFLCYENDMFVYLVPFAVATAKRMGIVKLLLQKYNFFSTYELTGLIKESNEGFVNEKLSAFFISVPNTYITSHRTGIRYEDEAAVTEKIQTDLLKMIEEYSQYFVLDLQEAPDVPERYYMHPKSYAFEFFKNFMQTSKFGQKLETKFQDGISLVFPGDETPIPYTEIKKNGFLNVTENVSKADHESGTAYNAYIVGELDKMHQRLADVPEKAIYVAYHWENEDGTEKGREYQYEFSHGGNTFIVESKSTPNRSDNKLYYHFRTVMARMMGDFVNKDNAVPDENALEGLLSSLDEIYSEDYKILMKYYQFYVTHGEEQLHFDVSKMQVGNLKNAMDTIQKRQHRFDTHQNYNEVVSMLVNSFTQGKDTMSFLREIKEQGGKITLQLDINKKYRFSAYGKQFMIPSSISNADMLEIIGEVNTLIKCGMLDGRVFDFPFAKSRYSFDDVLLTKILADDKISDTAVLDTAAKIYTSDLKIDRIALLGEDDKIIKIVEMNADITAEMRAKTAKYVVLRDDYSKPDFADIVELIITGADGGRLSKQYSSTEEPNQILPDQIPYYLKPLPVISRYEFKYLGEQCYELEKHKEHKTYKNYFAKDVNDKLFGYGGVCSVCGYESKVINSFTLKDFEVELLTHDCEKTFRFSLYLCANDAAAAAGWKIIDVKIGGMSPFRWLEEIRTAKEIPPEFLFCKIRYRPQMSFELPGAGASKSHDAIFAIAQEEISLTLTPMMAAKWYEENKSSLDN